MEVVFDLDTEAAAAAKNLGLTFTRVPTVGTHPLFVSGLTQLIDEHRQGTPPLATIGEPYPNPCPADCCPPMKRSRPAD
jgi:ferrochelatase